MRVALAPEAIREQRPYLDWGVSEDEYQRVVSLLDRLPNYTEIGLVSGMWSEHCAYKYSKPVLKQFWTHNERVLMGPGEGAGVIRIGNGKAVVFKAESHNHPSAVEPTRGPQRVSVASSAIFSRWVPNPSHCSIHSPLVISTNRTRNT